MGRSDGANPPTVYKLPIQFSFLQRGDNKCSICNREMEIRVTVEVSSASVRTTGGDFFSTNVAAAIVNEVVEISAEHTCRIGGKR